MLRIKNYCKDYWLKRLLLACLFATTLGFTKAQSPTFTFRIASTPLKNALDSLQELSGIRLFYNSDKINGNKLVSGNFINQTLPSIVKELVANPNLELINKPGQLILKIKDNEKHTWSGYIKEKGSSEVLIGVNLVANGNSWVVQTNDYGFFSITIPEGDYEVKVTYIGYAPKLISLSLHSNKEEIILLEPESYLSEVVIKDELEDKNSSIYKLQVPLKKIDQLPALLGESDFIKYLSLLPGVSKGNEANQGMYIRGGTPDQNLVMIDDATLYSCYHLFGFYSLFSGSELRSAELTKGGFSSKYGGRTSSVLNLSLKDGNREKWEGDFGIGLLSSHIMINGPIEKEKASVLLSFRRTYLDAITNSILEETEKAGYHYSDFNAKINTDLGKRNKLYFSIYTGKDNFFSNSEYDGERDQSKITWGNDALSFRWNCQLSNKFFLNTTVFHTGYASTIQIKNTESSGSSEFQLRTSIKDYGAKVDADYLLSKNHWIKFGVMGTQHFFEPNISRTYSSNIGLTNTNNTSEIEATEFAGYIEDNIKINQYWSGIAGFRLNSFRNGEKTYLTPEPRLMLFFEPNRRWNFNASYTHMSQFMNLISTGMIGLPSEIWVPVSESINPQIAKQISAGYAHKPNKEWHWGQEFFIKQSSNYTQFAEGISIWYLILSQAPNSGTNFYDNILVQGQMLSYGSEMSLKYTKNKLETWVAYTISKTEQQFDEINRGNWFIAMHDRRHDISWTGIYKIRKSLIVSSTWVYGSGFLMSLPEASFTLSPHIPQDANGNVFGFSQQIPAHHYGQKNSYRAAAFHHLDVSIKYYWEGKKGKHFIGLNVYNIYNRYNPFFYTLGYNENTGKDVLVLNSLIPILPSLNYKYAF
jgi:hypothetical protein